MAIDALNVWQSSFAALPKVGDASWSQNIANWVDSHVNGKLSTPGATGLSFSWGKSTFAAQLASMVPQGSITAGASQVADAWLAAINASSMGRAPGSFIGSPSPPTTWSSVATTSFDAGSKSSGRAKVFEIKDGPENPDPLMSPFPIKLREAFLLLTVTTTGTNSVSPPAGPNPLVDSGRAVA